MPTVRVRDALRYASKFVGIVLAVVVVAGGFVAGGAYLAGDAISLTDPSISALSQTPVFIGVLLLAVGILLGAIGWVALTYKFLVDGIATAMEVREIGATDTAGEGTSAEETTGEETTGEEDGTDSATAGTDSDSTSETGPGEPSTSTGPVPSASAVDAAGTDRPESDAGVPERSPATAEESASVDDAASADSTATTSRGAGSTTGTLNESTDRVEQGGIDDGVGGEASATEAADVDEQQEWTPPDPSEFEEAGSTDNGSAVEADNGSTGQADAGSIDDADEGWGTPAEESAADADRWSDGSRGDRTGSDTGSGASASTDGSPVDDVGNGTDPRAGASSPDPEDIDEEATLADEGVESFTTASDEDPLSDRLPGGDDN